MSRRFLRSRQGPELPIFKVRLDDYALDQDRPFSSVVLQCADSVTVIPITTTREIILVRQFRFGIQDYSLEIPGGFVDDQEAIQVAAARELNEETGYTSPQWIYLGWVYANPVFMTARLHVYLALEAQATGAMHLDAAEDVHLQPMDLDSFLAQSSELIKHPHTLSAIYLFHQYAATHPLWPKV